MNVQSVVTTDLTNDWRKFASKLFRLEEADPGYLLLKRADLPYATKLRYVLAWCTYYNPGIAALACQYEGKRFYQFLLSQYTTAKRASERRHFRGNAGLLALQQWTIKYPRPEAMIEACYAPTYLGVRKNMQGMAQMGDYFYWKLADIWDTVFDKPVDFTGCERYMPKVPKQGAQYIWCDINGFNRAAWVGSDWMPGDLESTMHEITQHIRNVPYPAKGGRKLALQEAETVCCVFKQHVVGDYRLGWRSAKAWLRLLAVREQAPIPVTRLIRGLYAGGVWNETNLDFVAKEMFK